MKVLSKNIIFYTILILITSCSEDRFSQVLEIDLPEETPVLAVTSNAQAGDNHLDVFVSHTLSALENPDFDPLPEAKVRFFENGTLLNELQYDLNRSKHSAFVPEIKEIAGTNYRLEVSADGYESVFAEQTMPTIVPIIAGNYSSRSAIDFEGEEVDELSIEFKDPAGEDNFYAFRVFFSAKYAVEDDTIGQSRELYLDSIDPLFEDAADRYFILNDRAFEGRNYTANLFFYPLEHPGFSDLLFDKKLHIQIINLTKDRYLYLKTLSAYRNNKDNPFAEPVTVHHNFENGTGTFTLESLSEFELDLEE